MSAVKLDIEEAKTLLKRAVDERGEDYVYPHANDGSEGQTCHYFDQDGTPSCIVGLVLSYKGLTLVDVDASDYNYGASVSALVDAKILEADEPVVDMLQAAQYNQDQGTTWGLAYTKALENLDATLEILASQV